MLVDTGQVMGTGVIVATANDACILLTYLSQLALTVLGALQQGKLRNRLAEIKWVSFKTWRTATLGSV